VRARECLGESRIERLVLVAQNRLHRLYLGVARPLYPCIKA
jgi:hypothetical protein